MVRASWIRWQAVVQEATSRGSRVVRALLVLVLVWLGSSCQRNHLPNGQTYIPLDHFGFSDRPSPFEANAEDIASPVIVAFGDELTGQTSGGSGEAYPELLEEKLRAAGYPYRVVNGGLAGLTTEDALTRIQAVLNYRPDFVVVCLGYRDALQGTPVQQIRRNLARLIEEFKANGVQVLLVGVKPPVLDREYRLSLELMYEDLASEYHVPLVGWLIEEDAGGSVQASGDEPQAVNHGELAEEIFQLIRKRLLEEGFTGKLLFESSEE